eukprot:1206985-Prymnesium_polylepis.1
MAGSDRVAGHRLPAPTRAQHAEREREGGESRRAAVVAVARDGERDGGRSGWARARTVGAGRARSKST